MVKNDTCKTDGPGPATEGWMERDPPSYGGTRPIWRWTRKIYPKVNSRSSGWSSSHLVTSFARDPNSDSALKRPGEIVRFGHSPLLKLLAPSIGSPIPLVAPQLWSCP